MAKGLEKIKGFRVDPIPPESAEHTGLLSASKQPVWKRKHPVVTVRVQRDAEGKEVMRRHMTTGEGLYKLREVEKVDWVERQFVLVDENNGNLREEPYRFPTQAELAARKRAEQIEQTKEDFAAAVVDSGIDLSMLAQALKLVASGQVAAPAAPEVAEETDTPDTEPSSPPPQEPVVPIDPPKVEELDPGISYPYQKGGPYWLLSSGATFKGTKKEAEEAEAEVTDEQRQEYITRQVEAKMQAAQVPEE
jgi:hypothetical protein